MLTKEMNELLTRTGPGTPAGEMARRYWHPVALSEEMPEGGAPMPVRIFGEDLVLFRDEQGRLGLLDKRCPHRCTDLTYGRIEDGGLRCLYHGWLFDVKGNCLEQPAEPENSTYKDEIKHTAYAVHEEGGMIFAYMGPLTDGGEPPKFPEYEFLKVPPEHRFIRRSVIDCNYLQSLEGEYDPAHLSFLHRPLEKKDTRPVPGAEAGMSADMYYKADGRPNLDYEATDYGVRIFSVRKSGEDKKYVRVTNFVAPNSAAIVGNEGRIGEGYSMHWHVAIDDTHHTRFDYAFNRVRPLDQAKYLERFGNDAGPDGVTRRRPENRYFQDRQLMKTSNFTGMGESFNVHDAFATESQGPVEDRTREHLGTTDVIIARVRRLLTEAIEAVKDGKDPVGVRRENGDVSSIIVLSEVMPNAVDHKDYVRTKTFRSQAAE
jgi:phenylpropionate dioxygenase-like ring-hydroxylating dioxygenase large terminal subunit